MLSHEDNAQKKIGSTVEEEEMPVDMGNRSTESSWNSNCVDCNRLVQRKSEFSSFVEMIT